MRERGRGRGKEREEKGERRENHETQVTQGAIFFDFFKLCAWNRI